MYVVATAGHVDHGKSTLVQALTGRDPDRWAEEKDRGLTIDLGFVWVDLPGGKNVAFVDVPGHEKFLGNMLAGIGPVPVVMFVVAADQGWQQQSTDHLDALHALGITHGLVALTRADKATPEQINEVTADIQTRLAQTGLAGAPIVPVSAIAGTGMEDLKKCPRPGAYAESAAGSGGTRAHVAGPVVRNQGGGHRGDGDARRRHHRRRTDPATRGEKDFPHYHGAWPAIRGGC